MDVRDSIVSYDPSLAVGYGRIISLAYQMYGSDPSNPTPAPPVDFPEGYRFIAWVQMKDFLLVEEDDWTFYGLIVQSATDESKFILAIRGTSNLTEWWDDLTSMALAPLEGFGNVGYGFSRIYQTLRVIDFAPTAAPGAEAMTRSLESVGTFAHQVAAAVQRHAGIAKPSREKKSEARSPAVRSIEVTGHSLGAALATLYVAENVNAGLVNTPLICTFASPRVGDPVFATKFDQLGNTSWRIVNELDVVPNLPFLGFKHVDTLHPYNSGSSVNWSLACWHSLNTYLHLLDPKQPLDAQCRWPPKVAATAPLRDTVGLAKAAAASSLRADREGARSGQPDAGAPINITINIGRTE